MDSRMHQQSNQDVEKPTLEQKLEWRMAPKIPEVEELLAGPYLWQ